MGGCAGSQQRFDTLRESIPAVERRITAQGFDLLALERVAPADATHPRVYIEGDGRPWIAGGEVVAADPTPRRTLALEMMADDPDGLLYLGRPCYFGGAAENPCQPWLWTAGRYSGRVVDAMADALRQWLARHPAVESVTLVGYSGGGVLALLIAERVERVDQVVAVATPVDHARWTSLHGYSPLEGSDNPGRIVNWRERVRRFFVFGEEDENVPPTLMRPVLPPGARELLLPGVGHRCCDAGGWGGVLDRLRSQGLEP